MSDRERLSRRDLGAGIRGLRAVDDQAVRLADLAPFNQRVVRVAQWIRAFDASAEQMAEVFQRLGLVAEQPGGRDE